MPGEPFVCTVRFAGVRAQLGALNADTQTRATMAAVDSAVATALSGTSSNSNSVPTLNAGADPYYDQAQMQSVLSKLDELITTLRR